MHTPNFSFNNEYFYIFFFFYYYLRNCPVAIKSSVFKWETIFFTVNNYLVDHFFEIGSGERTCVCLTISVVFDVDISIIFSSSKCLYVFLKLYVFEILSMHTVNIKIKVSLFVCPLYTQQLPDRFLLKLYQ